MPVILLSARAGEEARVEGLEAGADDYLVKPFTARELLARVEAHLKMARVRREANEALRHRAAQHETLLNQSPLGVYLVDADFRIREVNRSPCRRSAISPTWSAATSTSDPYPLGTELRRRDRRASSGTPWQPASPTSRPSGPSTASIAAPPSIYEWRLDRITLPDGRFGVVCYFP